MANKAKNLSFTEEGFILMQRVSLSLLIAFPDKHPPVKITCINHSSLIWTLNKREHEQSRHMDKKPQVLRASINTHPTSAAVFGSSYIFSDRVAFIQADGHGVADSHVCRTNTAY